MTQVTAPSDNTSPGRSRAVPSGWGAHLFLGTLLVVLAFFWWLLIYSGGVSVHHG